jgi:UDP-N-acetylmuramyl pentapeptide phosphotransferase/UDP-N-acetylglucosamine-1-phosphate transferase
MSVGAVRRVVAGSLAASATLLARGLLDHDLPGGQARWTRTNHRGEPVSLLAGPAAAAGLLVGGVAGAGSVRSGLAALTATASAATFGIVDDLTEDTTERTKGLRGHLGALARGRLTTGGMKVLGIGAGALVAAAVATPVTDAAGRRRSALGWCADVATSGALIAVSANLVNLLDLRPGRALKAVTLAAAPLALAGGAGAGLASAVVGTAAAGLEADLAERDMLGDGGANALGAMLGTAAVLDAPRPARIALLAGVLGLTLVSEKVSFTAVIARTPVLRELDAWGRRPVASAGDESRHA